MNGPVLDPDKEESTMEALGMIETWPGCTD